MASGKDKWSKTPVVEYGSIRKLQEALSLQRSSALERAAAAKTQRRKTVAAVQGGEPPSSQLGPAQQGPFDREMLQLRERGTGAPVEIAIGLDFGTSSTKVVVRALGIPGDPAWAIPFGEMAHPSMAYLLPTKIWLDDGDVCHLTAGPGRRQVCDMKLELVSERRELAGTYGPARQDLPADAIAAAYLGLVLRFVRHWMLTEQQNVLKQYGKLSWNLSLGVPSPCIGDNEQNRTFERVGKAAWELSLVEGPLHLRLSSEKLEAVSNEGYWDGRPNHLTCGFKTVPEIVAAAVGYAWSAVREDGLYLAIDVGASTLDICGFNLFKQEDQDRYSLLAPEVRELGALALHSERICAMKALYEQRTQSLWDDHDPLRPLTATFDEYMLPVEATAKQLAMANETYVNKCIWALRRVVWFLKTTRHPTALKNRRHPSVLNGMRGPSVDAWSTVLPVFLSGGGSRLDLFAAAVRGQFDEWMKENANKVGLRVVDIPPPENLQVDTDAYHRLTVAWGLSQPDVDLGEIISSDEIEDVGPPLTRSYEDYYVGAEQT